MHNQNSHVLAGILLLTSRAEAGILADSVTQFSGTQGQDGWYYGYSSGPFSGTNFNLMTQFDTTMITGVPKDAWFVKDGTYYTQLYDDGGHGNGTITSFGRTPTEQWAVRQWVSDYNGEVTISGLLAKVFANGGNGITGHIFLDGKEVYNQYIGPYDTTGVNYSMNLMLHVGSILDFAIDPTASNDLGDATYFTVTVNSVPEPSSLMMIAVGLTCMITYVSRKKRRTVPTFSASPPAAHAG